MPRVSDQVSCQNPKVSVVMITYNHEKFLGQAIEGVLMQETGFPVELVIGEDCSTDGTRRIALEYATKYPNVVRVLQPDRNLGVSRNLAATLAACRGGYVAMCEGDDYWIHPDKLQKQVSFLDANPAYVMCCHRERVFYEVTQEMKDMIPWLDLRDTYELQDVLGECFIPTGSLCYRRQALSVIPEWALQVESLDICMFALLAVHGKIRLFLDVMAVYRVHPGGVSNVYVGWRRLNGRLYLWKCLEQYLGNRYRPRLQLARANEYAWLYHRLAEQPHASVRQRAGLVYCKLMSAWYRRPAGLGGAVAYFRQGVRRILHRVAAGSRTKC